nr:unnamed protein product [Callosobruchus analis]
MQATTMMRRMRIWKNLMNI